MGRETLKIILSVAGAAVVALSAFLLFEALLPPRGANGGVLLFRFQMGAMLAMALFAGLAIVIYARLSRRSVSARRKEWEEKNRRNQG
jgi:hypothetical protein